MQRRANQNNSDQVNIQSKIKAVLEMIAFLEESLAEQRRYLIELQEQLKKIIYSLET